MTPTLARLYRERIDAALRDLDPAERDALMCVLQQQDAGPSWARGGAGVLLRRGLLRVRASLGQPPTRRALADLESSQPMEMTMHTAEAIQTSRKFFASTKRNGAPTTQSNQLVAALLKAVPTGSARVVEITPALAEALLERNEENRSIAHNRVACLASDITAGEWQLNNNGIGIGPDGQLWDGQHRLAAVLIAKKTIKMLVVGLEKVARSTIDQGRARSVGDNMRILDGEEHGVRIVSWLNVIEAIETRRSMPLSHAMVRARRVAFEDGIRYFLKHGPRGRPFYRAAIIGALVFAFRTRSAETKAFARGYTTGAELQAQSPALLLRDYVADHARLRGDSPRVIALKTLRGLQAHIRDETIDRLVPSEDAAVFFRAK